MLTIAFVFLTFFYCLVILTLLIGLFRLRSGQNDHRPSVSVIIAARNEATNIDRCLTALSTQTYPADRYEIIVVDDRSSDATPEIVRRRIDQTSSIRLVQVGTTKRHICPKKNALALGIEAGSGEILLFTDADCIPRASWLETVVRSFDPDVGLVAGFSPFEDSPGFLHRLLAVEAVVVAVLSAGSIGIGLPLACTARNLAYRRRVYETVGGFEQIGHIISGDDVLMMRQVAERTSWKIRYCPDPRASVLTHHPASDSLTDLFYRKVRHTSKAIHYTSPIIVLAICVYLFHLLFCFAPLFSWFDLLSPHLLLGVFIAKWGIDLATMTVGIRRLGVRFRVIDLLLFELLYPLYIVVFSALGVFFKFRWK
jgi:cellulose synthase/poly-beta-1,6-N-acetylglucosamine synthase-like glycosyltransferase